MKNSALKTIAVVALLGSEFLASACLAAPLRDTAKFRSDKAVAAVVNGDPIYVAEIEALLAHVRNVREVAAERIPYMQAAKLREKVQQRVVEDFLKKDNKYVAEAEVEAEIKKFREAAQSRGISMEQAIKNRGVTENTLRHEMAWKAGWTKYSDEFQQQALQDYFEQHKRDFDGTEVRASHILLRPQTPTEGAKELMKRAENILAQIKAKKLAFAEAAEKYSAGPSRTQGGDLGFFPRHGVMNEDFAKAAFALEKGAVSDPVQTLFGVHLIQVTDLKTGKKEWTESIAQLRGPATLELFKKLAEQEMPNAKVEYTGALPYFKPGTEDLVESDKENGKKE